MKTREQIEKQANSINGMAPGVSGPTRMLALVVELLLDIRDQLSQPKEDK